MASARNTSPPTFAQREDEATYGDDAARCWNDAVWRFEFSVAADVRGRLAVVASLSNYLGRLDGELPADLPHALVVAVEDLEKEIERAFDWCHDRLRELGELPGTSKRLEPESRA